jgi:hypothetical protein
VNAILSLAYADGRVAVNTLRALRRHPGRALMWALYALAVLGFAFFKTSTPYRAARAPSSMALVFADFWVCGIAVAFGVLLATGTSRSVGVFTSRAEALLITRAASPPLVVVTYLQLRLVITALARGFTRFAYIIVVAIPSATSPHALLADIAFFGAAGAAIASVALPRALARGATRLALVAAGCAIAAGATIPLLADALRLVRLPGSQALLAHAPALHPGRLLDALAANDLRALALPLAVAACASVAFVLAARDAYPELYTLSLANLDWRAQRQARRSGRGADTDSSTARAATVRSAAASRLRGAAALLWADALGFSRRVSPLVTAGAAALALFVGAALGGFGRGTPEIAVGILVGTLPGLYILVTSTTGVRLAPALRVSLFWLGGASLTARLTAWALGSLWRDAILVALAAVAYSAVSGDIRTPLPLYAAALGLLALTRAVGVAVFAVLPNALDQRGPATMFRVVLSFALVVPAVAGGAVSGYLLGSPLVAGSLGGMLFALGEAALLLAFAARQLAGRVDRLALS